MSVSIVLLGYPLGHSLSPAFQQAALDALGIPARYEPWPTPPEALAAAVARLRTPQFLGGNVTVPHKEAVARLVDRVDDDVRAAGAVNTIVRRNGALEGSNTDIYGFTQALEQHGQFQAAGRRALVLGAGGAARGVVVALARLHAASVAIANRTPERAGALAALALEHGVTASAVPWEPEALAQAAQQAELIINTTTLGMRGGPAPHDSPLPAQALHSGCLVYDLVYNPRETPLLRAARRAGARVLDGLPMLVHQGAAAFRLWTGREPPVDLMLRTAEAALAARHAQA